MADLDVLAAHPLVRRLLVPVLFVVFFLLFIVTTFPYDTLARRLEVEAARSGGELTIGSMGPAGILGVRARDVKLKLPPTPGSDTLPELHFERADLKPDLLGLVLRKTGFGFAVDAYGGHASGHASLSNDPKLPGLLSLKLDASDLDLQALPLKEVAGVELGGRLNLKINLPALQPADTANGTIAIGLKSGAVNGGSLQGFPIPKLLLGEIDGGLTVEKGMARVDKLQARGGDLDADVDGNIHLRPLLALSQAELHVRFKLADKWLDANSMIKGAMGLIQNARQGDSSYVFTFVGPLTHLTTRPGR